jgi:glycosyltransferase involved in cell wall biosynthesis
LTKSILLVNHTGQLGGAEIMLLSVAHEYRDRCHVLLFADGPFRQRLAALGVSVDVIEGDRNMLKASRQGGLLQVLGVGPAVLLAAYRLARAARGYDILYANSQKAAVIAMLAGAILRKPVVWYLHDILSPAHFSNMQCRAVVTLANWTARWVLTNSQTSLDAFVACGGDKRRSSVAPCGVDSAPFDAVSDAEAMSVRRELNLDGVPLVGLFGRISPWKGQHVLIEAMTRLDGVHAIIVGDALFGEQNYRAEVVQSAQTLGVADRVHWLGFRSDVPRLMRAVDAVLHTSVLPEPFGRVIVEGMMARRPVIAAADGASLEILGNGYNHLVKPGDPIALAATIEQVLNAAPVARDALIGSNYVRACSLFSPQRMIGEINKALERAQ